VKEGRSVASTMGFTAVDGLMMGTRCGLLDVGVVLYLMQEHRMDAGAVENLVYRQSGLLGKRSISSSIAPYEKSARWLRHSAAWTASSFPEPSARMMRRRVQRSSQDAHGPVRPSTLGETRAVISASVPMNPKSLSS